MNKFLMSSQEDAKNSDSSAPVAFPNHLPLSILDLVPVLEGSDERNALDRSLDLAIHAERWGYHRHWVAEHHNMPGIASSATSVVIGHLAQGTQKIRVGAGGIMLPNHSPLVIAEQFGTLDALFPGRIDLGLGRAPGTDGVTSQAMRKIPSKDESDFPRDVLELRQLLDVPADGQTIRAIPGQASQVPLYILGSSLFGAQLAAYLGLPFAFASHFAPKMLEEAIATYREHFQPQREGDKPWVILGFNFCIAETMEEAEYLRSSSLKSFLALSQGNPGKLPRPEKNFEKHIPENYLRMLNQMRRCAATGSPPEAKEQMKEFISSYQPNELMAVCSIYDHDRRLDSFKTGMELFEEIRQESNSK